MSRSNGGTAKFCPFEWQWRGGEGDEGSDGDERSSSPDAFNNFDLLRALGSVPSPGGKADRPDFLREAEQLEEVATPEDEEDSYDYFIPLARCSFFDNSSSSPAPSQMTPADTRLPPCVKPISRKRYVSIEPA